MRDSRVIESGGLKWLIREGSDDRLGAGAHEQYLVQVCRSVLPEGGTFVDVGAHVGLYTLRLADKAGFLYAIEANENTFDVLKSNVELNEMSSKITPIRNAVWDRDNEVLGLVDELNPDLEGSGTTKCVEGRGSVGAVVSATLDTLLSSAVRVDLIKVDVEGCERRVWDGALAVIEKHRPMWFIEMHDYMLADDNRAEMERRLDAVGYVHGVDFPFGNGYHWLCQPKENLDE